MNEGFDNYHLADTFLKMLDGEADTFEFRTFDDVKGRGHPALARKMSGAFAAVRGQLQELNSQGAGIFSVINVGGQTDSQITRVRAVFADTDGAPIAPLLSSLPPHMVTTTSAGRQHIYWKVDASFPLHRFSDVQVAIAQKFDTDPAIKNLSRVMRLPGFTHNKHKPFMVTLSHNFGFHRPYSFEEIVTGLQLRAPAKRSVGTQADPRSSAKAAPETLVQVEDALRYIDPFTARDEWMAILFAIADRFGEDGRDLAFRWSRGDFWRQM